MPHFFINSKNINSSQIIVDDKENFNHIAKSLRANIGEKLLLIDENRVEYTTNIKEITNKTIVCEIVSSEVSKRFFSKTFLSVVSSKQVGMVALSHCFEASYIIFCHFSTFFSATVFLSAQLSV